MRFNKLLASTSIACTLGLYGCGGDSSTAATPDDVSVTPPVTEIPTAPVLPETETPVEATPGPETPVETTPELETPVETTPEPETPVETTPEPETPVETTPEPETPVETTPEPETPVETTPEPETPVETTPEPETPVETTPEPETPEETTPEPETPVDTTPKTEAPGSIVPISATPDDFNTDAGSVNITTDFTDASLMQYAVYDMYEVANRTSPSKNIRVRPGLSMNAVRMVGGITKLEDGVRVPDLDFDPARYDEATGQYIYNFAPLTERIDAVLNEDIELYQIVLDQPPWAFQQGFNFIPEGQKDGVNFRENERISIYGNSLPPFDMPEYVKFLEALMQHLVDVYGIEQVKAWRYRIGSEIETPDHWYGTEQEFIEYFANSVKAVRNVVPDAIIGLHTRPPDFVFKRGTITNYKNEVIKSFASALLEYSADNDISFQFWGLSDYPIITNKNTLKAKEKFEELYEDLVNDPNWQEGTLLELHEFKVVSAIAGNTTVFSDTAQSDAFTVAMTDHFHEHAIDQIFQFGHRLASDERWSTRVFTDSMGKIRYKQSVISSNADDASQVNALIAKDEVTNAIDIIAHNFKPVDLEADDTKEVRLLINTEFDAGTSYYYRKIIDGREQNKFYHFMNQPGADSWLKSGRGLNRYGNAKQVLTDEGLALWADFENPSPRAWTQWVEGKTLARESGEKGSIIQMDTELPLYSYEKIEIKWEISKPGDILAGWEEWRSRTSQATIERGLTGVLQNADASFVANFRAGSNDGTFGGLSTEGSNASDLIGTSGASHFTGFRTKATGNRSIEFAFSAEERFNLDAFHFDIVGRGGSGATWVLEILDGGALSAGEIATGNIEASFGVNMLGNVDVDLSTLEDANINTGENVVFRLTINTPDNRNIDMDNVGVSGSQP